jgi:hypothetical protein
MRGAARTIGACSVAAAFIAAVAVASCFAPVVRQTPDAGSRVNALCSDDGTDSIAAGSYGGLTLAADCHLCLAGEESRGMRWTSAFRDDHGAILVRAKDARGDESTFVLTVDGATATRDGATYARLRTTASCDGMAVSPDLDIDGLVWRRATSELMTWHEARVFCAREGYRLPTMDELVSSRAFVDDGWFWSSTAGEEEETSAWVVTTDGASNANRKAARARVRCVR